MRRWSVSIDCAVVNRQVEVYQGLCVGMWCRRCKAGRLILHTRHFFSWAAPISDALSVPIALQYSHHGIARNGSEMRLWLPADCQGTPPSPAWCRVVSESKGRDRLPSFIMMWVNLAGSMPPHSPTPPPWRRAGRQAAKQAWSSIDSVAYFVHTHTVHSKPLS